MAHKAVVATMPYPVFYASSYISVNEKACFLYKLFTSTLRLEKSLMMTILDGNVPKRTGENTVDIETLFPAPLGVYVF